MAFGIIETSAYTTRAKVYITKPGDYPHSPSKLLLLLSSGTGIHSVNNQLQADKYASEGFLVVMPDQCVPHDTTGERYVMLTGRHLQVCRRRSPEQYH